MTRALGRIPDPPDQRDHLWRSFVPRGAVEVPPAYMVPTDPGPVLDQGQFPHCVGYSGAAIRTTQEFLDDETLRLFDGDDSYRRCKERDGHPGVDGTFIRVFLDIAQSEGVTMAADPFHRYRISSYTRLTSIQQIKESLVTDGPVQFGIQLDEVFMSVGSDGMIAAPTGKTVGGHAMAIYGYDDNVAGGSFRVRNSWSTSWGDGGWCWVPYSHFEHYPDFDAWRLTDLPNIAPEEKVVVEPAVVENVCAACGQQLPT